MSDKSASIGNITTSVGESFHVVLDVMGGTGYCWSLAHMPECVNLLDICHEKSNSLQCGSSERQIFTFVALSPCQDFLKFNLIRPWEPLNAAQKQTLALIITEPEKTEADELEETMGQGKFAGATSAPARSPITVLYMAPFQQAGDGDGSKIVCMYMAPIQRPSLMIPPYMAPAGGRKYAAPQVEKYAAPQVEKYAAPTCEMVDGVYKYAAPSCEKVDGVYKYAAPSCEMVDGVYKYAAPSCEIVDGVYKYAAPTCEMVDGVYKYAAPSCEKVDGVYKYAAPSCEMVHGVLKYAAPPVADYMAPSCEKDAPKTEE
ncbi:hypothetical protein GTO89_06835 [Heliobacterium gestii]|uniref:Proteinase inhibitor I42 chagasin domain-containing protein n=1 Tax=Heliomicrobium gestii TaxID=2699 RepID=A0A845LE77_HELGE|nr:protease inhibitor I42 family protein [Heliomicrobium gestii]MBM7866461.1 hypothetical protein [Heliomicrobium gestii]MZP42755.1 hypothetical protein [Heliomicrobium gestii]